MSTLAMLFAGGTDSAVPELTDARSMASVPFGCRYRLIDFTLSNLVNAGISHVAILTQHNYQSLMDHLGSGKEWDLARRNGGLDILPPFFTVMGPQASQANLFSSSLEGLLSARYYLEGCPEDTVILSDCESVNNLDVGRLLKQHEETGADLTIAVCRSVVQPGSENVEIVRSDRDGRVKEVFSGNDSSPGKKDVSMRLFAVNKRVLLNIMTDMSVRRYTDLARDFLARNAGRYHFRIYRHEGYHRTIGSLAEYFARNMELLDENVREQLFRVPDRPVLTKVHNSVPAVYKDGSLVRNSMIADGCVIEGIVENCILFRGVRVGKNTSVENCILMQDTTVEDGVYMNCVITDKNVRVREGRVLSGHQTKPFYIGKNGDV
ncbi:MAG: glucose-1-phosphate adenylyltransferase subunit GlgD [Clostridia bacterium]|nr:glucose-1-phosphate adenylyltransferase subunit GlgD [Clostridia bacterium]